MEKHTYEITLSIDPECGFILYVKAESKEEAIQIAKEVCELKDEELTNDYSKSKFADCFSCCQVNDIDIKSEINNGAWYIDENKKLHK